MVNFQIVSDLHIENYNDDIDFKKFISPTAEILILAGDIGRIHKFNQLQNFLKNICFHFKVVLYVLGNHEYYKVDNVIEKNMTELRADLELIRKDIDNLYILDRTSVVIDDVCISGCTLWSYTTLISIPQYIVRIKDINTLKYNYMFRQDLEYIKSMITYCKEKKLKLVVVTHHCPSYLLGKKKKNDRYKSLYCSNLDYLLTKDKIHTWICGHVHQNFDFLTKGGTRLVSNQKGKTKDKVEDFSLNKIIKL